MRIKMASAIKYKYKSGVERAGAEGGLQWEPPASVYQEVSGDCSAVTANTPLSYGVTAFFNCLLLDVRGRDILD
jgi:hypothetical protein